MRFSEYSITVTGADSVTRKKLELYREKFPDVQLFFAQDEYADPDAGIIVLPVAAVPEYFQSINGFSMPEPAVIAYGPPETMGLAIAAGCSDFLCEPWSPAELFERAARCRREETVAAGEGFLFTGPGRRLGFSETDKEIVLTRSESIIFRVLAGNRGSFIDRETIAGLTGSGSESGSRAVDMNISRLRGKLRGLCGFCPIRTASGHGWTMDPDP